MQGQNLTYYFAAHLGLRNHPERRVVVWKQCHFPRATWQKACGAQLGPNSVCRPLHGAMRVSLTNDTAYFLPSLPGPSFYLQTAQNWGSTWQVSHSGMFLFTEKHLHSYQWRIRTPSKISKAMLLKAWSLTQHKKLPFLQNFPEIQIFRPDHKRIEPASLGQESSNLCKNKPMDPH